MTEANIYRLPITDASAWTRAEIEAITRIFGENAQGLLGDRATEARVKALAGEVSILHFACHGWLDNRNPLDSGLALTINEDFQQGEENGILQAWEIMESLRLDASLVVLSACDSGGGREVAG